VTWVGFSNMIQRPNAKVWDGVRRDHEGQRNTHVYVKSETHAWVLLRFYGYCSQWVGSRRTDSQSILLKRHSWKTKKFSHTCSSNHCHKLDPSTRQCARSLSVLCKTVFVIQKYYGDAAASLLTWFRSLRFLLISINKISNETTQFCTNRRYPIVCNA